MVEVFPHPPTPSPSVGKGSKLYPPLSTLGEGVRGEENALLSCIVPST